MSVGASPDASQRSIRAGDLGPNLGLHLRLAPVGPLGRGWATRHGQRRGDVRLTLLAARLGVRRPRPGHHQPGTGDRREEPLPHLWVAMAEHDRDHAVVREPPGASRENAWEIIAS